MASSSDINDNPFRVLGVCGGIGSGKSQACKLLVSELGCLDHLGAFVVSSCVSVLVKTFLGEFVLSHIRSVKNEWSFAINISSLDADTIAHSVYSPGSQAVEDIRAEFGDDIVLEGNVIDRKKLGSIVFANRDAMSVC